MYSIRKRKLQRFISVFGDVGKARPPREKLLTNFSVNVLQNRNKWHEFTIIKFYLMLFYLFRFVSIINNVNFSFRPLVEINKIYFL